MGIQELNSNYKTIRLENLNTRDRIEDILDQFKMEVIDFHTFFGADIDRESNK